MGFPIFVKGVGKKYRRYHTDTPGTIHEALLRGFRKLLPAEHFWGLREVNLQISAGKTVGVVGRNGAGKSTLLRLIGGVGRPDEGLIEIEGRIGALLNLGAGFHPEMSGRENILVNGVVGGLTKKEVRERFDTIVEFSELHDFIDSPLRCYSSGMQMRLAFSIAIHSAPKILLIDEVLAVGDVAFQHKCLERIRQLKTGGCTIVMVTHDTGMVQALCEDALWLQGGRVAAYGPTNDVIPRYLAEAETGVWSHSAVK
ncbi:MAG: ABC transporter ATP-binding protein [Candidatus Solibacter sp.]